MIIAIKIYYDYNMNDSTKLGEGGIDTEITTLLFSARKGMAKEFISQRT
jgi:hypothetical protein